METWIDNGEPKRLCIFVANPTERRPIIRLPLYAEVVWIEPPPTPLPDNRFAELITGPLSQTDATCAATQECRSKVRTAFATALADALPKPTRDQLLKRPHDAIAILQRSLGLVVPLMTSGTLDGLEASDLEHRLEDAVREIALAGGYKVNAAGEESDQRLWSYPLGMIATDHVGYASYDLSNLPAPVRVAIRDAIIALEAPSPSASAARTGVFVQPYGGGVFEALRQRRITGNSVVMRLEIEQPRVPADISNLGILAMQNPSLDDWRLSPASFASSPQGLLGSDAGCESLMPSNLAVREYRINQVLGLADLNNSLPDNLRPTVQLGVVHEYRISWFSLGHSLGEILYSMPLAPGESVNLAVVDWTRRDDAQRKEVTTVDEQIVHDEHRDRVISETVDAAVKELQKGGSLIGGLASSAGISGTTGMYGVAAGTANAIGGSLANSSGSRSISAKTAQSISDHITQASTSARELQSTVIIHSEQAEKEAVETRT